MALEEIKFKVENQTRKNMHNAYIFIELKYVLVIHQENVVSMQ